MQYLFWSSLGLFFGFAFVIFLLTKYIITARKVTFFIFNKTLLSSLSGSLFFLFNSVEFDKFPVYMEVRFQLNNCFGRLDR